MPQKLKPIWLTRDLGTYGAYNFYFGDEPIRGERYRDGVWYGYEVDEDMDPWFFQRLFPMIKLDPGQGPIQVQPELHHVVEGKVLRDPQPL